MCEKRCTCTRAEEVKARTLVFLINAFKAPTPPRSPADIPSTSSMIKQVLWSTRTSATVVD